MLDWHNHTNLVKHLVALVEHEPLHAAQPQLLLSHKRVETTWGGDNYVRMRLLVGEHLLVLLDVGSAVEDSCLYLRHVLAKALVLVADLEGELTGVTHDQDRSLTSNGLDLLESAEHEDRRLSESRLGLAKHVGPENGLRNADLLDYVRC